MEKTVTASKTLYSAGNCAADLRKVPRTEYSDCTINREQPWDTSSYPKSSWQAVEEPNAPTWKFSGTHCTSASWRHHCTPKNACATKTHQKQHGPVRGRLKLPGNIFSYEEDVSFARDGDSWVKAELNLSWNGTQRTFERRMQSSAKHPPEDMTHLQNIIRQQLAQPLFFIERVQCIQLESRTLTRNRRDY